MANSVRSADVNIEHQLSLLMGLHNYNFYQFVELLCKLNHIDADGILNLFPNEEKFRFTSSASLGFPIRDISKLKLLDDVFCQLEVNFLGLHGSQSPLPGYYLESLAREYLHEENKLIDFMDLFNHRLILLLHQIWRKYRYYINYKDNANDAFSKKIFSLIGLESDKTREKLGVYNNKLLSYSGLLAGSSRSPNIISNLIAYCFDLDNVTVKEWVFRYINIDDKQQNRLGGILKENGRAPKGRSCLGENFTLGARVPDRAGKFELQLNNLSRKQFLSFLPNGEKHLALSMFVSFILKDQFAWDLRLGLKPKQVTGIKLGDHKNAMLGWISFLGKPKQDPHITLCVRE